MRRLARLPGTTIVEYDLTKDHVDCFDTGYETRSF